MARCITSLSKLYYESSRGWFFTGCLSYSESNWLTSHSVYRVFAVCRASIVYGYVNPLPFSAAIQSAANERLYYRQNGNNFLLERGVACVYTSIRFPTISGFLDLSTDLWSRARRRVNEKKDRTRRYLSGQPLALLPSRIPVLRQKDFIISPSRLIRAVGVGVGEPVCQASTEQISG